MAKCGTLSLIAAVVFLLALCGRAAAQEEPSSLSRPRGTWELGLLAGGGVGLSNASGTQFTDAGGRIGWIATRDHFSGWRRGNFEMGADLLPIYTVFTRRNGTVYGGAFKPLFWTWNFDGGRKIVPYFGVAGGVLFSAKNLPPGNTSNVNFTPQAVFGAHIFVKPKRALLVEGAIVHHSNSGLGTLNPGYNAAVFLTIGYSWFRGGR
jgi:hypothetical protein